MARRAKWRELSDDPRGPLGSVVRLAHDGLRLLNGYALLPRVQSALDTKTSRLGFRRSTERLKSLLPHPLPEGTFPVEFVVMHGFAPLGLDEGLAAFADGWLHVEGSRTSFSLRIGDGRNAWRRGRLQVAFLNGRRVLLWEANVPGLTTFPSGFEKTARRWMAEGFRPAGESILPPLQALPVTRKGWMFASLGVGLLALWVLSVASFAGPVSPAVAMPLILTLLASLGGLLVSARHAEAEQEAAESEAENERPPATLPQ